MVTLKKGDLTAEEARKIKQQFKEALQSNESGEFQTTNFLLCIAKEREPIKGSFIFAQFSTL